jgi:hypothetical protein
MNVDTVNIIYYGGTIKRIGYILSRIIVPKMFILKSSENVNILSHMAKWNEGRRWN